MRARQAAHGHPAVEQDVVQLPGLTERMNSETGVERDRVIDHAAEQMRGVADKLSDAFPP